jgi:hypothetical protein
MQSFDEHMAFAVEAHLDRRFHAVLQHVLGKHPNGLGVERLAARRRHVDRIDGNFLGAQCGSL